jgi:hypothetical protein
MILWKARLMDDYLQAKGFPGALSTTTMPGGIEPNIILGTDGNDTLSGTTSNETIRAGAGNDTINASSGTDLIDGGAGLDTFVVPHDQSFWSVSHSTTEPHNWHMMSMLGSVSDLVDVERIQFADIGLALDTDGVAGQAFRLYQAAFNRAPDLVGLGFWISRLDLGLGLKDVAKAFVDSTEFKTIYGSNPSNADLVNKFYTNVLHRAPDPGGNQFWIDVLDRHAASVADVVVQFSDSAENVAALVGVIKNGIEYLPYH